MDILKKKERHAGPHLHARGRKSKIFLQLEYKFMQLVRNNSSLMPEGLLHDLGDSGAGVWWPMIQSSSLEEFPYKRAAEIKVF